MVTPRRKRWARERIRKGTRREQRDETSFRRMEEAATQSVPQEDNRGEDDFTQQSLTTKKNKLWMS